MNPTRPAMIFSLGNAVHILARRTYNPQSEVFSATGFAMIAYV